MTTSTVITAVWPARAIEGGRISIEGSGFPMNDAGLPEVLVGGKPARIVSASSSRISVLVPSGLPAGGRLPVRVGAASGAAASVDVASSFATGLHQVDNPLVDGQGNLYVTYSGTRGQEVPVSIFRVRPNGTRETFSSGIVNPTSMAMSPRGELFVSSRFEGTVYRLADDGTAEPYATDLGVACGLAFEPDGTLLVGDRSGTIFKVDGKGRATSFATIPPSVAAFHLALSGDGTLFVTAPTLASYDVVYRVGPDGGVSTCRPRFGRPQGIAFDREGRLLVTEALAGSSGLYRFDPNGDAEPELVVSGPGLVGLALTRDDTLVVCTNDAAYRWPGGAAA